MAVRKIIWPVGGGKGGAGKSVSTANIGCALAAMGLKVVLVDADPALPGLHDCFGIGRPERGLVDFAEGRLEALDDAAAPTGVAGLSLISGAGDLPADLPYSRRHEIIGNIRQIDADCVIIDLGAGSTYNALDLFAISKTGIIVLAPEPAFVQNAYTFLKSFVFRLLSRLFAGDERISRVIRESTDAQNPDSVRSVSALCERLASVDTEAAAQALLEISSYEPRLLLNMASSKEDLKAVEVFSAAARNFLSIDTEPAGVLYSRASVAAASRVMRPFMLDPDASDARSDLALVVEALLSSQSGEAVPAGADGESGHESSGVPRRGGDKRAFGFNENVDHEGVVYHVQTEAHAGADPVVETIVYNGGRIYFSKRTVYKEEEHGGTVRDFADRQHRAAMAAIKMGKITTEG